MGKSAAQVRREIEETREELGEDLEELGERVSPKRIVQRRTARVRDGLHSVRESVMGAASTDGDGVAASAKDKAGSVAEQAKAAPDRVKAETQGNPLVAGLLAFGAGFLLGSVVPPSEPEQEAAQNLKEKLEPVQQRATEIGKGVASDLQESAQESLEKVKGRFQTSTEQEAA